MKPNSLMTTSNSIQSQSLSLGLDNAAFAKVIQFGDKEGFGEVVEAIRGAECWKEGKSRVCFVEVRRLVCDMVGLNSRR